MLTFKHLTNRLQNSNKLRFIPRCSLKNGPLLKSVSLMTIVIQLMNFLEKTTKIKSAHSYSKNLKKKSSF